MSYFDPPLGDDCSMKASSCVVHNTYNCCFMSEPFNAKSACYAAYLGNCPHVSVVDASVCGSKC